ncbi:MAG: PorP/SprF family type IX secretion system membrane protein [Bacteroidota bacterium]
MKLVKLLLFSTLTFCFSLGSTAQDIHFSMFDLAPTMLNPANTGAFLGSIRVGGLHRDQWGQSGADFVTTSLYADSPVLAIGKKKRDWIGVGMSVLRDVAGREKGGQGSPYFETTFAIPSVSIHKVLDKKGNSVFSFGVQGGAVTRALKGGNVLVQEMLSNNLLGGGGLQSSAEIEGLRGQMIDNGENVNQINFTDFSTGARLRTKVSKSTELVFGGAISHVVKLRNYTFTTGAGGRDTTGMADPDDRNAANKRPSTYRVHFNVNHELSDKLNFYPSAFFQTTKGLSETFVQANLGYEMTKDLELIGGVGFRLANAGSVSAGFNFKDWTVRMAYDANFGQVATARLQNTFEVGAMYIIKIYQEPVVDPVILCPKF